MTGVCDLKHSTMPRTNGLMPAEVTRTVASPSRAAISKRSRTKVMNSDSFDGCMAKVVEIDTSRDRKQKSAQ